MIDEISKQVEKQVKKLEKEQAKKQAKENANYANNLGDSKSLIPQKEVKLKWYQKLINKIKSFFKKREPKKVVEETKKDVPNQKDNFKKEIKVNKEDLQTTKDNEMYTDVFKFEDKNKEDDGAR